MSDNKEAQEAAASIAGAAQEAAAGSTEAAKSDTKAELSNEDILCNLALQDKDKGASHYKAGQYAAAKDMWNRALERLQEAGAPDDPDLARLRTALHNNLAMAALQLKEHEEVITHASVALRLDPENPKAFYRRGLANDALGKVHSAAKDLQAAARLDPKNAEVRKRYEEAKRKAQDAGEEAEDVAPVHNLLTLPRVFLDISVGGAAPRRLVFALYTDVVPKTAENFRQLCTGVHKGITTARAKPFHYKGSILHRMIPGLMIQGGDFENTNGTGGESIYGRRFADEGFRDKHDRRGLLAMANDGPNTNGSNFFVTFAKAEHLDRKHVIFGEIVSGDMVLAELESLATDEQQRPLVDCVVVDCGECGPGAAAASST